MLRNALQIFHNMGFRYVAYRAWHEVEKRTGLLKRRFPTKLIDQKFLSKAEWGTLPVHFFDRSPTFQLADWELSALKNRVAAFRRGYLTFFSAQEYEVKDWHTNPATGYRYDATKHWTEIPDFSPEAGDIKYVWEKSRFAFLYDLIRYDHHFKEDQSETVFGEIDSWIAENPVNCGPNWRCSQEISLRVMNWTFALHYYKNSPALTPERFLQIVHSINRQMQHVAAHIQFSRIAVRNNHALTETLALYLVGLLYPFFPESTRWKKDGKRWFEKEVAYQIYEDGTFLQFSMNYHRVVVQLFTWAIQLAHLNGERWSELLYERARKSLYFLRTCQDDTTGWLPNYGNNDGALFFPLSESHFRDFRPQLNALARALGEGELYKEGVGPEEAEWWQPLSVRAQNAKKRSSTAAAAAAVEDLHKVVSSVEGPHTETEIPDGTYTFDEGGYYVLRDQGTLTFIRCGHYQDRPFQADNLHLDIWVNGENILRDAGSYLYNTDERWTRYFAGTASHNTVMLGGYDQMRKGPRFIWYDWIKESQAGWYHHDPFVFEGEFTGFRQSGQPITHRRRVTKAEGEKRWVVEDWLHNAPAGVPLHQIWHPGKGFADQFTIKTYDPSGNEILPIETEGWYSEKYGQKVAVSRLVFSTSERYLRTEINVHAGTAI